MPDSSSPEPAAATRYEILEEIARGGMGVVYRVKDHDLDRILAMKRLSAGEKASSADAQSDLFARFLEEVQVTAQLDHPAIVPVHDLGFDDDGTPFYTMRYVKGYHLGDVIKRSRRNEDGWNLTRLVEVMVRISQALAYAHGKGVIHRDLKPRNLMVGDLGEVYVMDWGLARMLDQEDIHDIRLKTGDSDIDTITGARRVSGQDSDSIDTPLQTMDGTIVGTPAYMAPEQANGLIGEVDHLSDIYSLGAILYQILSGRAPYIAKGKQTTPRAVLSELSQGPPDPLKNTTSRAPAELIAICEKAMARRREDRYETTLALADDLQAYLDNRVVTAYERGPLAEAKKWMGRHRIWRWAVPSLGLITAISILAFVYSKRSEAQALEAMNSAQTSEAEALQARSQAEDLVDFTLRRIYSELASVGNIDVLEQVLTKVDAYLENLPTASLDRPRTVFLQSLTKHRRALIQRARGQTEASLVSMREAVSLRENYLKVAEDPDAVSYLASIYDSLGTVLREGNQLEEAETVFRKALPIYETILKAHPNDGNLLNNLANFRNNIGNLEEAQKNYDAATNSFLEAVALRDQILEKEPERGIVQFGRAAARANASRTYLLQGLIDEAIQHSVQSTKEMETLLATDATNALYLVGMGLVMRTSAQVDLAIGKYANARSTSQEALSFLSRAVAGDPSNVRDQARLATFQRYELEANEHLGPISEDQLSILESTMETLEKLARKQPKNTGLAEAWAATCLTAARLRAKTSPSRALTHLNQALTICNEQRTAIGNDEAAASFRWQLCHAACQKEAGRICAQINDSQESERHFTNAERDYRNLADRLSALETLELAELLLWQGKDPEAIRETLSGIDPRFVKAKALLNEINAEQ